VKNGVLVVDDMPQTRRFVARVLDREGYEVFEAENGAMAHSAARTHQATISVALVDVELVGAGGREVAAEIVKWVPQARIVFITGLDVGALRKDGRLPEHAVILKKPFTVAELVATVRSAGNHAPAPD